MSAVVPAGSTVAGAVARASVGADAVAVCRGSVHAYQAVSAFCVVVEVLS